MAGGPSRGIARRAFKPFYIVYYRFLYGRRFPFAAQAERFRMEAERQLNEQNKRRAEVEQLRVQAEAQIRRLDEEKAELQSALETRQREAVRFRMEAEQQLNEAQNRSRAEQEQFVQQTANLERLTQEVAHRRECAEAG